MCMHAHTIPQIQLLITRLHVQSIQLNQICYVIMLLCVMYELLHQEYPCSVCYFTFGWFLR